MHVTPLAARRVKSVVYCMPRKKKKEIHLVTSGSSVAQCPLNMKTHIQPMNNLSSGFHCLVAPAVPSCEVPTSVMSGSVVELRCQDKEGNPAPEYTWFKDGTSLLGNQKLGKHNNSYTMNTKSGILVRPFQVLNTNRLFDEINCYF